MNNRGNTFSLTIMVIIMALLAVFIGYLLGSWLIQLVTGDVRTQQAAQKQEINQEEIIEDNKDTETSSIPDSTVNQTTIPTGKNQTNNQLKNQQNQQNQNYSQKQLAGSVYVVQVGAFSNLANAESLKQKLVNKGFQAEVVDDGSLHKVQLATTSESEAKSKENELEKHGFKAFITH